MSIGLNCPKSESKHKAAKMPELWQRFALVCFFAHLLVGMSGCDSKASVKWENKERTAMQERIQTTISNPALGNTYKNLTANLNEDERQLLNTLVGVILNREPSKADKTATLDAVFKAVASIRSENEIRAQLPTAIKTLTKIAEALDSSVQRIAEGVEAGSVSDRIEFLNQTEQLLNVAQRSESFKNELETLIPKANKANIAKAILLWPLLMENLESREQYIKTSIKVSSLGTAPDFEELTKLLSLSSTRPLYFSTIAKLDAADSNSNLFVKIINRLPIESISDFSSLLDEYAKPSLDTRVKTTLVDAIRKSIALKESLIGAYFALLLETLRTQDPFIRLNSTIASVDTLAGEGFFGSVFLTNRRPSNTEPLTCSIQGQGNEQMKYSFKWIRNDATLIDWTFPSSSKTHTSQQYAIGDQVQCLVRILWGLDRVYEVPGELFTVRSAPPVFDSGETPAVDNRTMNQGTILSLTAEPASDPNGDEFFYRVTMQGKQGIVTQTSANAFEYRPVVTFYGQDEFRYQVCDTQGQCSDDKRVVVSIQQANLSPVILGISGPAATVNSATKTITMTEDQQSPTIQLLGQDDESDLGNCSSVYTISSLNPDLITTANIVVSGVFPFCQMRLTPQPNKFGSVNLAVTLTDFSTTPASDVFAVNITNVPDAARIIDPKQVIGTPTEDTAFDLEFAVEDVDGDLNCATMVTYSSGTPAVVANGQTGFASAQGTGCRVRLMPVLNANSTTGTSAITVTLTDGGTSAWTTAPISLIPVNDAPTIQSVAVPETILEDPLSAPVLNVTINDPDGSLSCINDLSYQRAAGETKIAETGAVQFGGIYPHCTATVTLLTNTNGTVNFSLRVQDNGNGNALGATGELTAQSAVTLNVTPLNDAPTVTAPATETTQEDTARDIALTIGDVDSTLTCSSAHLSFTQTPVAPANLVQSVVFSGTFPNCNAHVIPLANANGNTSLHFTVSDGNLDSTANTTLTINAVNDLPIISPIANLSTNEDTPVVISNIALTDVEDGNLNCSTLSSFSSGNETLLPNTAAGIVFAADPDNAGRCTITLIPTANLSGTSDITVRVTDSSGGFSDQPFRLTVNAVNDTPTITGLTEPAAFVEGTTGVQIPFTLNDDTTNLTCAAAVTAISNNNILLPAAAMAVTGGTIVAGSTTANCTLTLNPPTDASGVAQITLTATELGISTSQVITVTVTPVNDAPTIAAIADQAGTEDVSRTVALNLGDVDNTLTCSTTHLSFAEAPVAPRITNLVQSASYSGNWPNCSVTFVPFANENGTTRITLNVTDGGAAPNSSSTSFDLSFASVDDAPFFTAQVGAQTTSEETGTTVTVNIDDVDSPALTCADLAVTSSTSPPAPALTINRTGAARECSIELIPALNATGTTTISMSLPFVPDAIVQNFQLTVTPSNDPPTLGEISNQTTDEDIALTGASAVALTLQDPDNTLVCEAALSATASSNSTLLPRSNVSFSAGTNPGECRMALTPAANQHGSSLVTIQVSDGQLSATRQFTFTVTSAPDAISLDTIATQITNEDTQITIPVIINDPDGTVTGCPIVATSTVSAVVAAPGGIQFTRVGANCSATVTPVLNGTGSTQLDFVLTDNTTSPARTAAVNFQLTVAPVNEAPSLQNVVVPGTILEDPSPAPVINFTVSDPDANLSCSDTHLSYQRAAGETKIAETNAVAFGGTYPNCTATVTLVPNSNGTVNFTLRVEDNGNGNPVGVTTELTAESAVVLNVTAQNDAPTGTPTCDSLSTGNVFRTHISNGAAWNLTGCTGAEDSIDNHPITYVLESVSTAASVSGSFTCPTPISSAVGGSTIGGNFATAGNFGSCQYRLKACDNQTPSLCTALSANSVIISSYELTVPPPATPILTNVNATTCNVSSSSTFTASANLSSIDWQASTAAPGATAATGTVATSGGTASFSTNIFAQLLSADLLPATPTASTTLPSATASINVLGATLAGASANPPAAQIVSAAVNSLGYSIVRTLELLAVRDGDAAGAANEALEMHSDGQQPDFALTASSSTCNACTAAPFVSISSGDAHTCLVEANGTTKCWGSSGNGRLGNPTASSRTPSEIATTNLTSFTHTQVAAGREFSCLLGTAAQGVSCWGNNDEFQLGRAGSSSAIPSATRVTGLTNPIALSASKNGAHACAITTAGNAYCWGRGASGQLGNNAANNSSTAVQVVSRVAGTPAVPDDPATVEVDETNPGTPDTFPALPSVRSIAAGGSHTCGALSFVANYSDGLYCWGSNSNGQLGIATSTTSSTFAVPVVAGAQGTTSANTWFTQVAAGENHNCALRNDGAVFCWGLNSSGQLGNNTTTNAHAPVQVTGIGGSGTLANVVAISAGRNHSCAIQSDRSVLCWGANESGQLGNNSTANASAPVEAISAANSNVVALSAGGRHTCAVQFDGTARCWGEGVEGQLGNNTISASGNGNNDDCDISADQLYCSKTPALVQWTAGNTANGNLRPRTCHSYTIPP